MFKHVVGILFGVFCSRREMKRKKQTNILSTLETWTEKRRIQEKRKKDKKKETKTTRWKTIQNVKNWIESNKCTIQQIRNMSHPNVVAKWKFNENQAKNVDRGQHTTYIVRHIYINQLQFHISWTKRNETQLQQQQQWIEQNKYETK